MSQDHQPQSDSQRPADRVTPDIPTPELIGRIYDAAPANARCRMLEHLMRPLGVLALVGICNGIFAKIWFRSGWHDLHIKPEDAQAVSGIDVVSLVDFVQQASTETINGLVSLITASPELIYSASAAVLVTALVHRLRNRRAGHGANDDPADAALPPA